MRVRRRLSAPLAGLLAGIALSAVGGNYTVTKHGDGFNGVLRLPDEPRGDCAQCHDEHASRLGVPTGGPYPFALFAPDDNQLCATCHSASTASGIFQGTASYANTSHAASGGTVWPGPVPPSRPGSDAGKCVNCHDPHGKADASGLIPSMTFAREETLCVACHDGSPAAKDVASQLQKIYRHPVATITGKHSASEGGDPAKFAAAPVNNRHSECSDCHNPHAAARDVAPPVAPSVSGRLLATSRVRVTNGAAGSKPVYTYAGPADTWPEAEYELCFKCHSSWTAQPATQSDLGVLLNLNNPSFHPVEAQGKNRNIAAGAFANGWTWDRLTYCTDCHTSDDPTVRGPHGSAYQYILKQPYVASPAYPATTSSTGLCFDCHAYATYADDQSPDTVKGYSRFNRPQWAYGHTFHVQQKQVPCYSCHASHGSTVAPGLVAIGRSPGITSYTQTATAGTCTPSCHGRWTYMVNYAR
jgi:predicted CXXCH cytochrome family protein